MSSNALKYQGCLSIAGIRHNCLRGIQAAPVILLWLVFGWCFWAYLIRLCGGLLHDGHLAQGFNMSTRIAIRLHLQLYSLFFRHPVYRIFPAAFYLMHMEFLESDQHTSRSTCRCKDYTIHDMLLLIFLLLRSFEIKTLMTEKMYSF